jgi:MPBQ/MSBQ methyltransferase
MDVSELVRRHYGGADLVSGILAGLAAAGVDPDDLTVDQLAAVDQLHAGFSAATRHLLDRLELRRDMTLLDVGCGIGGPARMAAAQPGCQVLGVDLSPDFIDAAQALTARVGLSDHARFRVASADDLDLEGSSFERAMMLHVGMNLPDKAAVFAEVRRVLRPGGVFGLYEQMRTGPGELRYPLPWAEDDRSSFVASPEDYARDLEAAGFRVGPIEDRTAATRPAPGPQTGLTPAAVFGPAFVERLANNIAGTRAGALSAVLILATAV